MATTGGTALAGDLVCQLLSRGEGLDVRRTAAMATWAGCATGPFLHAWVQLMERLLPVRGSRAAAVAARGVAEMAVAFPLVVGGFFAGVGWLRGGSGEQIGEQLRAVFWPTMKLGYVVFLPASLLANAFVPAVHRVLFINVLTFFWQVHLSKVQAGSQSQSASERPSKKPFSV